MKDRDARMKEIAYHLWEMAGRPDGESDRFWHAAIEEYEAEIRRLRAVAKELAAAQPKTTGKAPAPAAKANAVKLAEPKETVKAEAAKPKVVGAQRRAGEKGRASARHEAEGARQAQTLT